MVKKKLCRQNHTTKHTHTHSQKEKKEKNIYIVAPKVHHLNFGMIHCLFRYSTDTGYIKLLVEIKFAAPEAAGRDFPFSSLFAQLLGFSFGCGPASICRSPEGVFSSLRQGRVKGAADSGALAHSGQGERRGTECVVSLRQQRPA